MDFLQTVFDFSNVPDAPDYEPLPEGQYHIVVTDIENSRSKAGNPLWKWQMTVLAGPYRGRHLSDQATFTEKGLMRVKYVLGHLADVDASGNVELAKALKQFVGKQAIASVVIEEQQGMTDPTKTYRVNRVEFRGYTRPEGFTYLPYGGAPAPSVASQSVAPAPPAPTPKKNGLAF